MLPDLSPLFNRLRAALRRLPAGPPAPSAPPDDLLPRAHPARPLPAWVASDPVVQQERALLGARPWAAVPARPPARPWPGPAPAPRAAFVAAYLLKLHAGKRALADRRAFRSTHPALVWWLGFRRVPDPSAPHGFDVAATVPRRRHFGSVLRSLPNGALPFLLDATVGMLRATRPSDQQARFGATSAGATQALLAWVKQNNPKIYSKDGRRDKDCQPSGDPAGTLGVKRRRNVAPAAAAGADPPTPSTAAQPASRLPVGVASCWGYAAGSVVTRLPDGTAVVLAERTRPFNESDPSDCHPLMAQGAQRLGRTPRFGTWDPAFDAHSVYAYVHQAGGFAAVPFNPGKKGADRQCAPDGAPVCAAQLAMPRLFT